ncbi:MULTISPECIES: hypothetical protein [unclassified Streptomyces]|uniref:hypothetical protein n=1 Tax=unclassified Streptomyces TaxID=2593676 RepID=UPI0004CAEC1D|nr:MULTISPECIES: hypothetical protein [unclassified Streptomyces]KJY23316.1 hypothetical protein VR43_01700 [Streptomyces sp. NRRL S-104]KOU87537.1 hypothetical protein ADK93_15620 [Streptomyces sp. XY58]KOV06339.1 hypothetical protein ADK89_14985 [Streptomyces sp. XY37]KOV17481.1 hypothetical protein ADK90_24335 [Streptomyces sp. XY413]KOV48585.1 hypothetical protein ADK99_14645 [Streptomyces sp. MMG1064]
MTETITEPQAPPETAASTPPPADTGSPKAGKDVEHTPGGFPVVPLSLTGTNAAAGLFATAAIAGGPVAAVVAMTGAAVLSTAAAHRRNNNRDSKKKTPTAKNTGGGGRSTSGRIPAQPRTNPRTAGGAGSSKSAGGRAGGRSGGSRGKHSKPGKPSVRQRVAHAAGGLAGGRAGQVQALRQQARAQTPTRAAARTAAVQARRQVADTRRATKAAERMAEAAGATPRGPAARTLAKGMTKAAATRDKAVSTGRSSRDRAAGRAVANGRAGVREAARQARVAQLQAPAQKAARKALLRSAARFQARRALAAVLGGALGLLGMVTTPLGRKLGWAWLQHPGRRLYRYLIGRARAEREDRDADIRNGLEDAERAAEEQADAELEQDAEGNRLGERAERPEHPTPAPPTGEGAQLMDSSTSGFRFEELAVEMEQAAQAYEPENAMEILAMVEGLPEALGSIANIMRILAERSDSEFPLEKEVADGFADIYGALNSATAVAEDLGPVFRCAHEADIARHEDPRNGPEAEKGWNV